MNVLDFLITPAEACQRSGPNDKIVFSSRVRLARNLKGVPFPGHAKKADRLKSLETLVPAVSSLPQMGTAPFAEAMDKLSALDKQILVERHLISREHAAKGVGSAFVLNQDETVCVMVNEEDHLRMQALRPGLQLKQAWMAIDGVDSSLQEKVEFAFADQYGFLTACPTNLGTGIRVSAMLHLPGLVLAEQINQIIQAVNKLGLAVRGLYGEGTEALWNIFQVSNQMTLGETEGEIVERINKVLLQIIEHEENARQAQLEKKPKVLFNHIGRAYGGLSHSHIITSKETMNLLSLLRLGVDLGLFGPTPKALVDELFLLSQPGHLQIGHPEKLDAEVRDALRADLLRERMKSVPAPDHTGVGPKPA
ncbi:MAG TPA: protein arginine kinase [Candidatus Limnocylindria bacterium]|nr:protein arginine kinase [Candidatus Limnocylindria bacterium]